MALSAIALVTACTNDETIEVNRGEGVTFNVVAGKATRTGIGGEATTTSNINKFHVYAFTQNKEYMDEDVTKRNGIWTYDNIKFWPETNVDFYSYSPNSTNGTVDITATGNKQITKYKVPGDEDLLYALNLAEKKTEHEGKEPVLINFRHALAQIVFKIKNTNPSLTVFVDEVKVDGIEEQGTFVWPKSTTEHWKEEDTEEDATWGKWKDINYEDKQTEEYPAAITPVEITGDPNEPVNLTSINNGNFKGLLLLPQILNPWIIKDGEDYKIKGTARVLVKCRLTDTDSGIQLWPHTDKGQVTDWVGVSLIGEPKEIEGITKQVWKQGKRYIYTLIFGEGGGFNPNPDPDPDPDPKPESVLVPITFDVTVDDFIEYEQDLETNIPDSRLKD